LLEFADQPGLAVAPTGDAASWPELTSGEPIGQEARLALFDDREVGACQFRAAGGDSQPARLTLGLRAASHDHE
jgi:hypothetical protein